MNFGKILRRAVLQAIVAASILFVPVMAPTRGRAAGCSGDNGGLSLPPGFCASVVGDHLGHVRHLIVAPNGVVYANTWSGRYYNYDTPPPGGFLIAIEGEADGATKVLRFGPTPSGSARGLLGMVATLATRAFKAIGRGDVADWFGQSNAGGTGIAIYKGYLYAEANDRIVRYVLPSEGTVPTTKPEIVVSGLPLTGDHPMHPFQIDEQGNLYVDLGSATNSCQSWNRMPNVMGDNPCTELQTRGGTWRYDANRLDQHFSPAERFSTGLRNGEGFGFDSAGRIFATQHGRDQLAENFASLYKPEQGANEPAEELVELRSGADFGWPECYYDYDQKKLVLAPEYGGDGGKKVGVCAQKQGPVAAFPAHWAPNDLLIYKGGQFPAAYRDGAFIAFHGSWNRAPGPQGGYNVVFQPLADGKAAAPFVVFADGFAGAIKEPGGAAYRPTGLAVASDGSLYIADDQRGRIWHVTYHGDKAAGVAAATSAAGPQVMASHAASPPEGIHPDARTGALPIPPGGSPDQVALGDRIFHGQEKGGTCAGCHGSDGKGSTVGSDLTGGKWLWGNGSLPAITSTINSGVPKAKQHIGAMPPKGGAELSQADVAAVAEYVWALGHRTAP